GYLDDYEKLSFSKRLEIEHQLQLASQVEQIITEKYSDVNMTIKRFSKKQAQQGYNSVWYAIEGSENIQLGLPNLSQSYVETLVNKKIDGKRFSQRLYKKRTQLAKETTNAILGGAAQGQGY